MRRGWYNAHVDSKWYSSFDHGVRYMKEKNSFGEQSQYNDINRISISEDIKEDLQLSNSSIPQMKESGPQQENKKQSILDFFMLQEKEQMDAVPVEEKKKEKIDLFSFVKQEKQADQIEKTGKVMPLLKVKNPKITKRIPNEFFDALRNVTNVDDTSEAFKKRSTSFKNLYYAAQRIYSANLSEQVEVDAKLSADLIRLAETSFHYYRKAYIKGQSRCKTYLQHGRYPFEFFG